MAWEARFDGKWVLQTDTDLPPTHCALRYKDLWMIEQSFRSVKSVLETRPIYHKCDETIRGHVFCSFLALMLLKAGAGATVNAVTDYGETALTLACVNGDGELVEELLAAGANAKASRNTGETALMIAAGAGSVRAVEALIT